MRRPQKTRAGPEDLRPALCCWAILHGEGDGWVNWSGLATRLAKMAAFAGKVYRFFLTLRLDQPHQDAQRSAGEVELRDP
jgi:hypothetical protein